MSVVSTISDSRKASARNGGSGDETARGGRAFAWVVFIALWVAAMAIMALSASAVVGLAS